MNHRFTARWFHNIPKIHLSNKKEANLAWVIQIMLQINKSNNGPKKQADILTDNRCQWQIKKRCYATQISNCAKFQIYIEHRSCVGLTLVDFSKRFETLTAFPFGSSFYFSGFYFLHHILFGFPVVYFPRPKSTSFIHGSTHEIRRHSCTWLAVIKVTVKVISIPSLC